MCENQFTTDVLEKLLVKEVNKLPYKMKYQNTNVVIDMY